MDPDPEQSRPESPTLMRYESAPVEPNELVAMGEEGRSHSPHTDVQRLRRLRGVVRQVAATVGGSRSNRLTA